jgi:ribonucrease Y
MPLFPNLFKSLTGGSVIPTPVQVSPTPTPPKIDERLEEIQSKAREIILEAKDEALRIKDQAIKDTQKRLTEIKDQALALTERQKNLLQEEEKITRDRDQYAKEEQKLAAEREKLQSESLSLTDKLEKLAGLSRDEARQLLLDEVRKDSQAQMAKVIKDIQNDAKITADDQARQILVDSMRLGATDYVAEYTVSTVELPGEDIKAKIIGKDGRNIRTFENRSGVDIDMDETPGVVRISCFDSVRREIARVAMVRLIKDGRIQPARIEEFLEKAKQDIDRVIFQEGEKLCHVVGVYNLPRDLVALLGKFKYRTSYGQNMISHTLEETRVGIKLASEVKANVDTVRLACLLHDIGKVVDEAEGSHVELGVKILKKYNLPQTVIDCVAQHHEDESFTSVESVLVYIADAISGARPGARHENYDEYIKRISSLESIAKSYSEVDEAFAIQAGRELRVIVNSTKSNDDRCIVLATEIRNKIQDSLTYPGTVKVTVIREVRAIETAK